MTDVAARVWRFLRSRKLAVWLLIGCTVWALLGTLVPQEGTSQAPEIPAWAAERPLAEALAKPLGLHRAYTSPLFLVALALLGLSTCACSVERTRWALRATRSDAVGDGLRRRLVGSPDIAVPVAAADPETLEAALRSVGLRTRRDDGVVIGEAGRIGVFGSTVFHWSLAALFVIVAAGQLTRFEGLIGVPVGSTVPMEREAFGRYEPAALYRTDLGGMALAVRSFDRIHRTADGYDRGASPYLALMANDTTLAAGWVYPNNPLRHGPMLIHMNEYGIAIRATVLDPGGTEVGSTAPLADWSDEASDGVTPIPLQLAAGTPDAAIDVTVTLIAAREKGEVIRAIPPWKPVRVVWSTRSGEASEAVVRAGDSVPVPGGSLRIDDVVYYARVSVVDDWSVYPIYALFGTATLGLMMAVFAPRRMVWLMLDDTGTDPQVVCVTRHGRGDPVFAVRVEEAIRAAVGATDEEDADG